MKRTFLLVAIISLCATTLCFGGRKIVNDDSDTDSTGLITAITPGSDGTSSIVISGDDSPFVADAHTTIVVDGKPAQLTDVQVGMQVISRTAADSSAPEIDLKTVVAAAPAKKGKKKNSDTDEQQ